MLPTDQEHNDTIRALMENPDDYANARRILNMTLGDPDGAEKARERVAPSPHPLSWELVHEEYHRHNLHMQTRPKQITSPLTLGQLVTTLQEAADQWLPIKAIGDGYGFSNTGFTRGYMLPMVRSLNRILTLDTHVVKYGYNTDTLCKFEAGATIQDLNQHLWPKGKALWNQPGYENLTFVGTLSSGGHGSGTWLGPLSSQVRALHIVTINDKHKVVQYQVEPQEGMSDPARFQSKYPHIELVQDDRMFHSCTVAMGCLGVIYSATIEVRKAYNIKESRKKHRWVTLRKNLPKLLAEQGPDKRLHSIEVWVNPYSVDGHVHCVLGEREETQDPPRNSRSFGIEYGGPKFLYRMLSWFLRHHPSTLPVIMDAVLDATQAQDVIMHAPEGLNFGAPNQAPVLAAACGVPTLHICELIDDLIDFFQKRRLRDNAYISSPIGLRFVKAAEAHMSPAFGRETCMIEVPTIEGTPDGRKTLNAFHDFLFNKYNGRPHWGQINDMPGSRLELLYPQLEFFLESFRILNPKGFFDNNFTDQMGFRIRI